jgi:hypothetical protein
MPLKAPSTSTTDQAAAAHIAQQAAAVTHSNSQYTSTGCHPATRQRDSAANTCGKKQSVLEPRVSPHAHACTQSQAHAHNRISSRIHTATNPACPPTLTRAHNHKRMHTIAYQVAFTQPRASATAAPRRTSGRRESARSERRYIADDSAGGERACAGGPQLQPR